MVTLTLNVVGAAQFCSGALLLAVVAWVVNIILHGYRWRMSEERLMRGGSPEQLKRWRSVKSGVQVFLPVAKPFAALGWVIAGWRVKQ